MQHVVHHIISAARMTYADAQALKLFATQMVDDVTQTIMTTVSAAGFQAYGTRIKIQLIVSHQNIIFGDFVEVCQLAKLRHDSK